MAVTSYPLQQRHAIIQEGLEILDIHRGNYSSTGPDLHQLQIIWWEFPPEHWDALKNGSPMNFIIQPEDNIHPNVPMDIEQKQIAGQFVDELTDIVALGRPPKGIKIRTTTPLFCVPKPGQKRQWRVIADMKSGGKIVV